MATKAMDQALTADGELALLTHASLADAALRDNPYAFYAALRHQRPVFFDDRLGMYLVARHEDAQTVLRDSDNYSAEKGYNDRFSKGFFAEFKEILEREGGGFFPDAIKADPPQHTRLRRLLETAFSAHRVKQLEPQIREIAVELARDMGRRGTVDGVRDFAVPMTIRVICRQLGISEFDADQIRRWAHALMQQIGLTQSREQMLEHARLVCECQNYLIAQIEDRRRNPREDMISDLVHAKIDGEEMLSYAEVVSLVRALLVAGHETTQTGMSSLVLTLATRPDIAGQLRENVDDDRVATRFVMELLRQEPPIKITSRMTTREVKLGEVALPEGAHLLVVYGSANNDETEFPDPRRFDLDRPNLGRNITFGAGPHRCVGAALASMEVKVAAQELVRHLAEIKLTIPPEQVSHVDSLATHGIAALPLLVKAADAP